MKTIFLRPDEHFDIINDAASFSSAAIREQGLRREPCSHPRGTPHHLAYVRVVYFNSYGCVDMCTGPPTLSNMRLCVLK